MIKTGNGRKTEQSSDSGLWGKICVGAFYLFIGIPISAICFSILVPFAGAIFVGIYLGGFILIGCIQPIGNRLRKKGINPQSVDKYETRAFYVVVATIALLALAAGIRIFLISKA